MVWTMRPCILAWAWSVNPLRQALAQECKHVDSCTVDETTDVFTALQKNVQHHNHGSTTSESVQTEWRDALQAEMAFFERAGRNELELKKKKLHRRHVFVENAQAPPQSPPYGPNWQQAPYQEKEFVVHPLKPVPEVSSTNGRLEVTLEVDIGWIEVPGTGVRVQTRLYNGSYPGPTLRMKRGDMVVVKLVNKLGRNVGTNQAWPRREGQATYEFPHGIPRDHPFYQDVGQSPNNPLDMKAKTNNLHDPNTTNFHVHGWHVSPHEPQDNVIDVAIPPDHTYVYRYELSPYHSGGNSWYHAHWHGAVTMQTVGGMVGGLIIDDSDGEAPKWMERARQETLVIHETNWDYFGPRWPEFKPDDGNQGCFPFGGQFTLACALAHRASFLANLSGDALWRMQYQKGWGYELDENMPITSFWSVNGQYRPTMTMKTGEWVRLRLIYGSADLNINPIFDSSDKTVSDNCEMWLIAKDNAWIEDRPRRITKGVFLGAGNRAQVMVRCAKPGVLMLRNNVTSYRFHSIAPDQTFMFIKVTGKASKCNKPPKTSPPSRPRYLQNLVNIPYSELADPIVPPAENVYNHQPLETFLPMKDGKTIGQWQAYTFPNGRPGIVATASQNQPVRFTIQNMTFSHDRPMASFPVGEVIEAHVGGLETHWWHMHTNPVQYTEILQPNYKEHWGGYYEIGDWHDVLALPSTVSDVSGLAIQQAKVRWQTDCYQGVQIVHCHVLYHEDLGMFTWFNATGKNHQTNPKFQNSGIFRYPPKQCTKKGQRCAPNFCAPEYKYASSR